MDVMKSGADFSGNVEKVAPVMEEMSKERPMCGAMTKQELAGVVRKTQWQNMLFYGRATNKPSSCR
jgi:hypothetical protein